jgi:DNA adenine methylase
MNGRPEPAEAGRLRVCVADNIGHLYGISLPANLMERFDQGRYRSDFPCPLSDESVATNLHMKGPLSYIGGKNRIANQIIEVFPEHTTYVEAFAGGAQVLFHKEPSRVEVLNDVDGEVVNFFRVCQSHYEELLRCLRFILVSRRAFAQLKSTNPEGLTDIQRAARYFYLLKNSFAALVRNPNYHHSVEQPPSFNVTKLPELIEAAHKRLRRVQIESLPYQDVLQKYDRPTTLFYLDPPYFGRKLYRFNFVDCDFEELEHRLRTLRGKFILSLNDVPEVRKLFSKFQFQEIALHYTSQREAGKRYPELLITNFRLKQRGSIDEPLA